MNQIKKHQKESYQITTILANDLEPGDCIMVDGMIFVVDDVDISYKNEGSARKYEPTDEVSHIDSIVRIYGDVNILDEELEAEGQEEFLYLGHLSNLKKLIKHLKID